jgi:hypothetical protein
MDLASFRWGSIIVLTLLYWVATISVWLLRLRGRTTTPPEASIVTVVSEKQIRIASEERIHLRRAVAVLFLPPAALVIMSLIAGS